MPAAIFRIFLYLALIFSPTIVMAAFHLKTEDTFIYNIGRGLALLGFGILIMQVVLAARLKWVEKPFGLNLTFPFHRRIAIFATLIFLAHPLLLAAGGSGWSLLIGLKVPWYIFAGPGHPPVVAG